MVRNYRHWLQELADELQEAIRESENNGWHHEFAGSAKWTHYQRLLTWNTTVEGRLAAYDNATT